MVEDRKPETGASSSEQGMILIVMLWIMTALAVMTLNFSRESRLETMTARNALEMERDYFIARAGIESAIYQILAKRLSSSGGLSTIQAEPDAIDIGKVTGRFDGGLWQVNIQDESGKVNLNTVSEQQLRLLLQASGVEGLDLDILTDSILDWRDTDSLPRANGAEIDYYQELPSPYAPKNTGRFDAVEELLLVRGMTRDYFYGKPERLPDGTVSYLYGLSRFFTVYSTRDQINVNQAPLPVLLSVPGMPPESARAIYEKRQTQPFRTPEEISREVPMPLGAGVGNRLTTAQTGVLTLTAEAHLEGSRVRRVVRAVISLNAPGMQIPYQTLYWNENVSDYEGES